MSSAPFFNSAITVAPLLPGFDALRKQYLYDVEQGYLRRVKNQAAWILPIRRRPD